jgi:hypothetical protein
MSPAARQTTYLVKLKDRRQVAERTMAFSLRSQKASRSKLVSPSI